ncbi:hypothetical protein HN873_039427, partial [Arachis hypogaea]
MRYLLHLSIVTINNISLCLTLLFPFILSNLVIDSLQNCKDTLATCQNELEAAKSEIQSWHSSIQNEPCVPAGATPEPKMLLDYLQALKSSEESLREQLEKAKKKEAAFIVTFAKREQEIAELKVRRLLLDPAIHEEFTRLKVKKMGLNKDEMHMLMKFRDAHASRLSLIQINPRQYHLMRLVAFAVLPPSGCCSVTKELEGSTPCHQ